jgi:hypothetical protein
VFRKLTIKKIPEQDFNKINGMDRINKMQSRGNRIKHLFFNPVHPLIH